MAIPDPVGADITDEDLTEAVRKWTGELGAVPTRNMAMKRFEVGAGRATRIINMVQAETGLDRVTRTATIRVLHPDRTGTGPPQPTPPDRAAPTGPVHHQEPNGSPIGTGPDRPAALPPAPDRTAQPQRGRPKVAGVRGFYAAALVAMLLSVDTSWRFFGAVLHITDPWERAVMFAVIEVALLACGWGMRANVQRTGRPGAPRLFAWALCATAGYMAWQLSGVAEGIARVTLGPVLGLVMLHLALGIEVRAGSHKTTTWAKVGRELRERLLSRVGLADDTRDALTRTRDRAMRRAARLTHAKMAPFRSVRVDRALRASGAAHNETVRTRLLAELAVVRHSSELRTLDQPSPWRTGPTTHGGPVTNPVRERDRGTP